MNGKTKRHNEAAKEPKPGQTQAIYKPNPKPNQPAAG
jgi:hypothetical protein